jgi:uncharacterized protein
VATSTQYEAFRESWRPTQKKVDLAVKLAVEIANPSRVYVFGSWARGEATIDSDLDLAVLIPEDRRDELEELDDKIRHELADLPMSIDLLLVSEGEFSRFQHSVNSVYYKIGRQGALVYSQN